MANKNKRDNDSRPDGILKQVFTDDLPPEVEGRMKANFAQFRDRVEQDARVSKLDLYGNWKNIFLIKWAARREVLAFSSLIMIVVGAFLHVSGHRSAMAETLSFLNTSVSIADQIESASSMECRIRLSSKDDQRQSYTIRWLSPGMTRVDVFEKDKASKTMMITDSEITVNDHINDALQKYPGLEQVIDPVWQPAMGFLSPMILASAIYHDWKPQHFREEVEDQGGTFVYVYNGERTTLEMAVDMNVNLPLRIRKYSSDPSGADDVYQLMMEAQFIWNEPISLEKISCKDKGGGEK